MWKKRSEAFMSERVFVKWKCFCQKARLWPAEVCEEAESWPSNLLQSKQTPGGHPGRGEWGQNEENVTLFALLTLGQEEDCIVELCGIFPSFSPELSNF
ncbi:uncharacterized [Tachysurus ichikawai]